MGKHPLPTQTGATPDTEVHNMIKEMAFVILLALPEESGAKDKSRDNVLW